MSFLTPKKRWDVAESFVITCCFQMEYLSSGLIKIWRHSKSFLLKVACFQLSPTCFFLLSSHSSVRSLKMAHLYQFWGHGLDTREPRRHGRINLGLTRHPNSEILGSRGSDLWGSARRSSPGKREWVLGMEWVQTAHADWVKKSTLKFKRLQPNLNKHRLMNDQKLEPWETFKSSPNRTTFATSQTFSCAQTHWELGMGIWKQMYIRIFDPPKKRLTD